jgi:serine/threonine-protein kinase
MDDLVGTMVAGRFAVLGRLGAGGMGTVYRAHDRELDEQVALKVLSSQLAHNPAITSQFRHEVKLARRVTHPNIARTFELGAADGLTYYTMELITGESLRAYIDRGGPVAVSTAVEITRRLCDGLAAAHARDVIHRDIKPENILLSTDGRVVLADFGIATLRVAEDGLVAGTPAYMAPEQARGEAAVHATDIYALGLVLYEMVTGKPAFTGSAAEIMVQKQEVDHVRLPASPPLHDLATVIARATARDPIDRLGTASELSRMLAASANDVVAGAPTPDVHDLEQRTLILIAPQLRSRGRSHVAFAVYRSLLARLARVPRLRLQPRQPGAADSTATVVDLFADDTLHVVITPPSPARSITFRAPLAAEHVETTAAAVASAIAEAIDTASAPLRDRSAEVHDLVFRARELLGTSDAPAEACDLLDRARTLAPESPLVAAFSAAAEIRLAFMGGESTPARVRRARELVGKALRLGPDVAEAQVAAGGLELNVGDPTRAARHFRAAIACDPFLAEAHGFLGRMLLEAGFITEARGRFEHAAALDPRMVVPRWDLARSHALDGNWAECERLLGSNKDQRAQPAIMSLRFAIWRRDLKALEAIRQQVMAMETPIGVVVDVASMVLSGEWHARRDELLTVVHHPDATPRRRALLAQIAAEISAYFGDTATCGQMLIHATNSNLFDLHWLERCGLLDAVRSTALFAQVVAQVKRRAEAVLDALYSDRDGDEIAGTAVL